MTWRGGWWWWWGAIFVENAGVQYLSAPTYVDMSYLHIESYNNASCRKEPTLGPSVWWSNYEVT